MKKLLTLAVFTFAFFISCEADKNEVEMKVSNKEKVIAVLESIETGAQEAVSYINANNYVQHNQSVGDGLAGFGAVLGALNEAGGGKVEVQRIFKDGEYIIAHTKYDFFGPKAGIDIFRFEDGLIVEHWDNLQKIVTETASGRTMFDGPSEVVDLEKTVANKTLIDNLMKDVFFGENPNKITEYISTEKYDQHNPGVKDGLAGLGEALTALAEAGMPMVYEKNHIILGEGNFVLSVSEGIFMKEKVSFYDIFRIENGKVVEHWDTIEKLGSESEAQNTNGKFNF